MPVKRKTASRDANKIIDVLPADLRKAFKKPHLQDLTFSDLNNVSMTLLKFAQKDPRKFTKSGCSACLCC